MNGAWGVYSELPSGRLLVSDRKNGLFLLDFNRKIFETAIPDEIIIYPNPIEDDGTFTVRMEDDEQSSFSVKIYDVSGRIVHSELFVDANYAIIQAPSASGMYSVRIAFPSEDQEEIAFDRKIVVL